MTGNIHTRRSFVRSAALWISACSSALLSSVQGFAQVLLDGLENVKGEVLDRSSPDFESKWRSMSWYLYKPERRPELIVSATSEQDVVEAISYAEDNKKRVVVRSSGHNSANTVLRENGLLLDLSQLREVTIDADNQTAWVAPGIRSIELYNQALQHGLAFPAAHTAFVGLGGYLLGGGLGWNLPEYGIACRSILAAEVVLADGRQVLASEHQNQDLLWAVRGSGPAFFGAVVRYQLQLQPLRRVVQANNYVIPASRLTDAFSVFDEIGDMPGNRIEILIKIGRVYPSNKPHAERDIVCMVSFLAFADSSDEAEQMLQPVANSRLKSISIFRDENISRDHDDIYSVSETDSFSTERNIVENIWTDDPGSALLALTNKMQSDPTPSPRSFLLSVWSFNKQIDDPSSCVQANGRSFISWYLMADDASQLESNKKWMDESVELTRPQSKGRYINEINPFLYPQHVQECFSVTSWERLGQLRNKYDPGGVFHTI